MNSAQRDTGKTGAILHAPLETYGMGYHRRTLAPLGMACALASRAGGNPGGIPYSELGAEAVASWFAIAAFTGRAAPIDENDSSLNTRDVVLAGTCALTLVDDRLLGILDADDEARQLLGVSGAPQPKQTVWFAAPRADINVTTTGEQGLFSKRPALIDIDTEDWTVVLRHVSKLSRACTPEIALNHNSAGARAEKSLVEAFGAS
jgi:hypothetical protein